MSEGPRSRTAEHEHLPPGAERFWGQVSETRAGRSHGVEQSEEEPASQEEQQGPAEGESQACLEWCPICRSADLLRATTSPEAIGQVQAIQQEAVGVLKAFLNAYGERGPTPGRPGGRNEPDDSAGSAQTASDQASGQASDGSGRRVRDISID